MAVEIVKDGNVISRSKNLAGLRRWISGHSVASVFIHKYKDGSGYLCVKFHGGDHCTTTFASYSVLCHTLRHWRNLYGAKLFISGTQSDPVHYGNPDLATWERHDFGYRGLYGAA